MDTWIREGIAEHEAEHGAVPPPWVIINEHPGDICWRMGVGEGHLMLWDEWWRDRDLSEDARVAYFRKWPPPHCWLCFVIGAIWDVDVLDFEVEDETDYFERAEQLGFGSEAEWLSDFNDPKWLEDKQQVTDRSWLYRFLRWCFSSP
jgi:hypothetical protein